MGPGLQEGLFPDDGDSEPALAVVCSPPTTTVVGRGVSQSVGTQIQDEDLHTSLAAKLPFPHSSHIGYTDRFGCGMECDGSAVRARRRC